MSLPPRPLLKGPCPRATSLNPERATDELRDRRPRSSNTERIWRLASHATIESPLYGIALPSARNSPGPPPCQDRKSTRLNSSHVAISYAVFCLKKKKRRTDPREQDRGATCPGW